MIGDKKITRSDLDKPLLCYSRGFLGDSEYVHNKRGIYFFHKNDPRKDWFKPITEINDEWKIVESLISKSKNKDHPNDN
jgi:hypothetical protein